LDFWPKTTLDVYSSNLYCLSWFYDGAFPYDTWEEEYDNNLCEQAFSIMYAAHTRERPADSSESAAGVSTDSCI